MIEINQINPEACQQEIETLAIIEIATSVQTMMAIFKIKVP